LHNFITTKLLLAVALALALIDFFPNSSTAVEVEVEATVALALVTVDVAVDFAVNVMPPDGLDDVTELGALPAFLFLVLGTAFAPTTAVGRPCFRVPALVDGLTGRLPSRKSGV